MSRRTAQNPVHPGSLTMEQVFAGILIAVTGAAAGFFFGRYSKRLDERKAERSKRQEEEKHWRLTPHEAAILRVLNVDGPCIRRPQRFIQLDGEGISEPPAIRHAFWDATDALLKRGFVEGEPSDDRILYITAEGREAYRRAATPKEGLLLAHWYPAISQETIRQAKDHWVQVCASGLPEAGVDTGLLRGFSEGKDGWQLTLSPVATLPADMELPPLTVKSFMPNRPEWTVLLSRFGRLRVLD
jgi:hypothetical protein